MNSELLNEINKAWKAFMRFILLAAVGVILTIFAMEALEINKKIFPSTSIMELAVLGFAFQLGNSLYE